MKEKSELSFFVENAAEYLTTGNKKVGEGTIVIISSVTGTTSEIVDGVKKAQKSGARVIGFIDVATAELAKLVDYVITYPANEQLKFYMVADRFMYNAGEFPEYEDLYKELDQYLATALVEVEKEADAFGEEFANRHKDDKIHYFVGAGNQYGATYSYAMCYWEEQHWIRTKSIHSAEFFHGMLEIIDKDTPVTVFIGEDSQRSLSERVANFLPRICGKYNIIDTKKFELKGISPEYRGYISHYDSLNESYPGGNPVNVAVYIKRLGGESSYTGAVGTDSFGKIMISAIQNKGVDTSHVQVLDGKTAVTHVDIVDGDRVFGKYEEGVLADFKLREQDISFIKKHDLAVTGIWGMIEDELPLISKEIPVAFDFANKFANPIVEKAIPYVTYAFFSFDEESRNEFRQKYHSMGLKEKENCTEQLKEFMKAMQQKGPKVIIATLGKNGSIGYDGNSWYRFGIIECKVVDTMGAGDSFIAGFLYGILNGLNVQDSMEAGAQNSAVTIGYQGAW